MFKFLDAIIFVTLGLVIGVIAGFVIGKNLQPENQKNRELEEKLSATEKKLADYQQSVTDHFVEASNRINQMTQSYKELHEHLATSALELTNPEVSKNLLEAASGELKLKTNNDSPIPTEESDLHIPKDWAPTPAGEKDQLSENFGLGESEEKLNLDIKTQKLNP